MNPRLSALLASVLVAATTAIAGCAPGPAPKPTHTPLFTSEAEAFKAAEQVYRDYTEEANASRNGDSKADPEKYLAGTALEDVIKSRREIKAAGLTASGSLTVQSFAGTSFNSAVNSVLGVVCIGIGDTRVTNDKGQDVTPTDRPSVSALSIEFASLGSRSNLVITKSESSSAPCLALSR